MVIKTRICILFQEQIKEKKQKVPNKTLYKLMINKLREEEMDVDFIETYAFNHELVSPNVWEKNQNDKSKVKIKTVFFVPTIEDLSEGGQSPNVGAFSNYLSSLKKKDNSIVFIKSPSCLGVETKMFETLVIFLPSDKIKFVTPLVNSLDPSIKLVFMLDPSLGGYIQNIIVALTQKEICKRPFTLIYDQNIHESSDYYSEFLDISKYYQRFKFDDVVEKAAFSK